MITTATRQQIRSAPAITLEAAAGTMRRELEGTRLSVVLIPAPDKRHSGHKIRVVEQRNPAWYRDLCADHLSHRSRPRRRKPKFVDTLIRRRNVLRALDEISRGGVNSLNAERALPYVESFADWMNSPFPNSSF